MKSPKMSWSPMFKKGVIILAFFIMLLPLNPYKAAGNSTEDVEVLLVYSTKSNQINESIRYLQLLIQHFTNHVKVVADVAVLEDDVKRSTHLIYFGDEEKKLPNSFIQSLNPLNGTMLAIGHNVDQLPAYEFLTIDGNVTIHKVKNRTGATFPLDERVSTFILQTESDVLRWGVKGSEDFPLFIRHNEHFYFGSKEILGDLRYTFADLLHDVFQSHPSHHEAYLRLEDIHPKSDAEKLLEVGNYLIDKGIPFMMAVIPVYVDPNSGEIVRFSSNPDLVKVMQYLQQNGGSVILHEYKHAYRYNETGEGFEFWDAKMDQPITSLSPKDTIEKIKNTTNFSTFEAFNQYQTQLTNIERTYITDRLSRGVYELIQYDLYPIAFEAPHYTMSQLGYELTSQYFSTLLGQIQLGDRTWKVMNAPPYTTTWKGMLVLPETIGFIDPNHPLPVQAVKDAIEKNLQVRDSMLGAFYHPYLGVEYLPEFIEAIEAVNGVEWIDLKELNNRVTVEKATIHSKNGLIEVNSQLSWWDKWSLTFDLSTLDYLLWGIALLVFLSIVMFVLYTLYLRLNLRKRLFLERKQNG